MAGADPVRFEDAEVIGSTHLALLVDIGDGEDHWIPRSVIHDDSEVFDDNENAQGTLVLKEWFAEKEGLG